MEEINERQWCVYMHINKTNGKKYIGQTCQDPPSKRWANGLGYKESPKFYNAIQKYGWNNFEHIIIQDGLSLEEANRLEEDIINKFNTMSDEYGYNLQSGGLNKLHSDITKEKMKASYKIRITEESKRKMSKAKQNMYLGDNNPKAHPVVQLTTDNIFVKLWGCIKDAADYIGVNEACIRGCCKGRQQTSGGYKWMYEEDYEEWIIKNKDL